jgi:hypothetical protein
VTPTIGHFSTKNADFGWTLFSGYLAPVPDFDVQTVGAGRAKALLATPSGGCAGFAGAAV